ncbi:hypothetical protein ACFLRC_01985 [Candidatus Altiarchaeota archaeon]
MSVLITDGESHVTLAAVRSLGRGGLEVTSGSPFEHAMSFYSKYCSHRFVYPNPREREGDFVDKLEKELEKEDYEVLFPGDSGSHMQVSRNRKTLSKNTLSKKT